MADFSIILKQLRIERDLSQQEVADAMDLNKQTISQYERGVRKPNFEITERLADFFSVDLNYLMGFTDKIERVSGDDTDKATGRFAEVAAEELELLRAFRHADDQTRRIVLYALHLGGTEK